MKELEKTSWVRTIDSIDSGLKVTTSIMYGLGNISENLTTEDTLGRMIRQQSYTALYSVLLVLLVPPQLFLSILTIVGLCTGRTFRKIKAQRNLMILMAGMGFVSSASELMFAIAEYLFVHRYKEAGVIFCHGASWFVHVNGTMRSCLLTALSVTVYIILKHGHKKIRSTPLYISLVGMLVVVLILGIPHLVPAAISYSTPLDGVICFTNASPAGYVGISLAIFLLGIPARFLSIGVIVAGVIFVKKHRTNITEHKELKVAMIKLTACLIILNVIVFAANLLLFTPNLLLVVSTDKISFVGLTISVIISGLISQSSSAIATPLAMMIVFKPLRKETKRVLFKICCRDIDKNSNEHRDTSTSTPYSASKDKPNSLSV